MDKKSGKLNNNFTRFGGFTWGEHDVLRRKLEQVSEQLQRNAGIRRKVTHPGSK